MKLSILSLRPSWPNSLLPIEKSSPCFDKIIVKEAPQLIYLMRMSKLRLFGTVTILFLSWTLGSEPCPSYPLKSQPCEKYSVYPSVTSSAITWLLISVILSLLCCLSRWPLSKDKEVSCNEYRMMSYSFL